MILYFVQLLCLCMYSLQPYQYMYQFFWFSFVFFPRVEFILHGVFPWSVQGQHRPKSVVTCDSRFWPLVLFSCIGYYRNYSFSAIHCFYGNFVCNTPIVLLSVLQFIHFTPCWIAQTVEIYTMCSQRDAYQHTSSCKRLNTTVQNLKLNNFCNSHHELSLVPHAQNMEFFAKYWYQQMSSLKTIAHVYKHVY